MSAFFKEKAPFSRWDPGRGGTYRVTRDDKTIAHRETTRENRQWKD
jgi:hypothetical protein